MPFVYAYFFDFFADFLRFDMSLLLLTVTLWGVSNKHCFLPLFSFYHIFEICVHIFLTFYFIRIKINAISSIACCLYLLKISK